MPIFDKKYVYFFTLIPKYDFIKQLCRNIIEFYFLYR